MNSFASEPTVWPVLDGQPARIRDAVVEAFAAAPPRFAPALATQALQLAGGQVPPAHMMHQGAFLDSVCTEAVIQFRTGNTAAALLWGKAAYLATRRPFHCWLPFIDIAAASALLAPPDLVPETSPSIAGKIPHDIAQFWDRPNPPADVARLIEGWRSHDGFAHLLFDDAAAQRFLAEEHDPGVLAAYDATPQAAGKADLFRLGWLARRGGVYIDADDRRVGSLACLLPAEAGFVVNRSPGPPPCINNWFVAARPDHPLVWRLLRGAVRNLADASRAGLKLSPWTTTGPGLYSMTIMDEFVIAGPSSPVLRDVALHTEAQYREVVQCVLDLDYRSDNQTNWKLAYAPP